MVVGKGINFKKPKPIHSFNGKKKNKDFLFYQDVKKNVFVQSIYKQNMTFDVDD